MLKKCQRTGAGIKNWKMERDLETRGRKETDGGGGVEAKKKALGAFFHPVPFC